MISLIKQFCWKEWVKCGMRAVPAGILKFITASANVQIL